MTTKTTSLTALVLVASASTLVLAGCGGSDAASSSTSSSSSTATSTSSAGESASPTMSSSPMDSSSPMPSASSSDASTGASPSAAATGYAAPGPAATGPLVKGAAYSYHVPAGWVDGKAKVPAADTVRGNAADKDGFADNINVMKSTGSATELGDPAVVQKAMADEVKGAGATVTALPMGVLDGEPAVRQAAEMTSGGRTFHVEQWVSCHAGKCWILTLSTNAKATNAAVAKTFSPILASWKWAA